MTILIFPIRRSIIELIMNELILIINSVEYFLVVLFVVTISWLVKSFLNNERLNKYLSLSSLALFIVVVMSNWSIWGNNVYLPSILLLIITSLVALVFGIIKCNWLMVLVYIIPLFYFSLIIGIWIFLGMPFNVH